ALRDGRSSGPVVFLPGLAHYKRVKEDLVARYTDAKCRLCRREGEKLFLKGTRCTTAKCAIDRQNYPPGQHGQNRQKLSTYAQQLREKQKAKRLYGILERQFRRYFFLADSYRGVTGT